MKHVRFSLVLLCGFFVLSSFSSKPFTTPESEAEIKAEKVAALIQKASEDGNISNKELRSIVKEMKGASLNVGEKVALKLNRKKISKNLVKVADSNYRAGGGKSQLTAVLLCFFLGGLGIHRYYLGYIWQGVVQTLTLGGLGIWALIDFIRILTGSLQPKDGEYEKTL